MKYGTEEINSQLLDFIARSPSVFHTVNTVRTELEKSGFIYLKESDRWSIVPGGKYYTVRNSSSVIAFSIGNGPLSFKITASHGDSPTYKLKAVPVLTGPEKYLRLDVEAYGGMIDATWLDRPLTLAGRAFVRTEKGAEARLVYIDRDLLLIPNVAIHFNREVNSGYAFNRQTDLCPMLSAGEMQENDFRKLIAGAAGVQPEELLDFDLFLVNRQKGCVWGVEDEFISSPRLDDLQCVYASLAGFLEAEKESHTHSAVNVFCCFDNEEVGSGTQQGALSTFLKDCLTRIAESLGADASEYSQAVARSFLLSADNAHAVHPNHPEKTDAVNRCFLNGGLVIKENAAQKYTTDAFSRAVVMEICKKAGEPFQTFANRSDCAGGSTLGNLSNTQVSLHAADVGLPSLAMHSSFETAGAKDTVSAVRVFEGFYASELFIDESDGFQLM